MDDAVGLADICNADACLSTLCVDDPELAIVERHGERLTLHGLQGGLAAVLAGIGQKLGRTVAARDDVVGQDPGQLCLVFRLDQCIDSACRQLFEGRIGGRENSEGPGPVEGVDQAGCFDRCNQRGVILGIDGVLDDGPGGVHFCPAHDDGVGGENRGAGRNEYGEADCGGDALKSVHGAFLSG